MPSRRSAASVLPTTLFALGGLFATALYGACSSGAAGTEVTPDGAGQSSGGTENGSGGVQLDGGRNAAGGSTATMAGKPGTCSGAGCGSGTPGTKPADAPCSSPSECESGRCEPVTGTEEVVCLAACFADGAPCERALDCCSTGCFDGKCGGLCTVEGDSCSTNAECCSNICEGGECRIDLANPDCRPTGEDCTSGSSRGCCNECDKATDRCGFGAETCRAQGAACGVDSDCCRGVCDAGACRTPCAADGSACATATDCCSVSCGADGRCAPPGDGAGGAPGVTCAAVGEGCKAHADCCSDFCFGSFCELPVQVK